MKVHKYIRTCQSCGQRQEKSPPNPNDKSEKWRDIKCVKCKSPDLDYGSWQDVDAITLQRVQEED